MINQLLTRLSKMADALTGILLFPGEVLLSLFARVAPDVVAVLTYGNGALIVSVVLALSAWTVLAILGLLVLRLCGRILHQLRAMILTLWHRTRAALTALMMRVRWKFRDLFPRDNQQADALAASTVEFDDLDIAILHAGSAEGPGLAFSAPDLAERFSMRPAQVQGSLNKLSNNRLLTEIIGSTDGFENYRVTDSGWAFVAKLQREQARG